jgi:hypothetical protein
MVGGTKEASVLVPCPNRRRQVRKVTQRDTGIRTLYEPHDKTQTNLEYAGFSLILEQVLMDDPALSPFTALALIRIIPGAN